MASGDMKSQVAARAVALCRELSGLTEKDKETAAKVSSMEVDLKKGAPSAFTELAEVLNQVLLDMLKEGLSPGKAHGNTTEMVARALRNIFKDAGDDKGGAAALAVLANLYLATRQIGKALQMAEAALSAYRSLNDQPAQAKMMDTIIEIRLLKSTAGVSPMIEYSDKASQMMEAIQREREQEGDIALETAKEVVTLYRVMDDRKGEAMALNKVAEVHIAKEEPDEAKQVAREVRNVFQELNDPYGEATALNTIVNANMLRQEDSDDAVIAAKDVVKLFRGRDRKTDREDRKAIADALHTLAKVHFQRGEVAESLEAAEDALDLYNQAGVKKYGSVVALQTIAGIHMTSNKRDEAMKAMQQAAESAQDAKDKICEAQVLHAAAELDFNDLFTELEAAPKAFNEEHQKRMEYSYGLVERALELYRSAKHAEGEGSVLQTSQSVAERSRKVHAQLAEPVKTVYITDPKTQQTFTVKIFDPSVAGAKRRAAPEEELGDEE